MLQAQDPFRWWSDFIGAHITAAEARSYLQLSAYEWVAIPGLGTSSRIAVTASQLDLEQLASREVIDRPQRLFAREFQQTTIKVVSLDHPDLFRRWLAAERPEHLEYFDAAIASRAIELLR